MPLSGVSPQAEQGKRKRNLILISATLVMLIVGSIFEFALRAPQLPVASNLVVLALLNLNVIVFLLSQAASWVTGVNVTVDGGQKKRVKF